MKIDSGTISMDTGRFYTQSTETTQELYAQNTQGAGSYHASMSFLQTYAQYEGTGISNTASKQYDAYLSSLQKDDDTPLASDLYTNMTGTGIQLVDARSALEEFRQQLIEQIEQFMEQIRAQLLGRQNNTYSYIRGEQTSFSYTRTESFSSVLNLQSSGSTPGSLWTLQLSDHQTVQEAETTTFQGKGTVQTADGRNIDFGISMEMSRSFKEESTMLSEQTRYILTDPLVIQLDDAPDTISDQTWFFDLDGDGIKEEISQLAKGNGFLALDENENGIIDDGSELFGTASGNGFKDLAAYDEDGNGWIDENDSVYQKLKIWTKDANGKDTLMNLQQADIGAIYLGYADTEFTHKTADTNETQAVVRQTGMYLHESTGAAGIVQQIDFASRKPA